jgi:tetratricopeptide (TPR) repeat protein
MKKILFIFILLVSCFCFSQNKALFEKANKAYNTGDYNVAAKNYLKIIENGEHSAELYFNLGNVYYKQNQVAPSIYYFEKALLLKPNDKDIKNNLAYAQNMTLDAIEVLPKTGLSKIYKGLTSYFTFDQWAYTSVILMLLFILGYLFYYFLNYATQKRIAFILSFIFFFLSIVSIAIAYIEYDSFKSDQPAIVFDEEVIIKSEPNNSSQETFRLHQGTKVNVIEKLNDWNKVKITDGKTGWLSSESIRLLKDI